MTIQDFNEALSERKSAQLQAFAELKQPRVRQAFESADGTAPAGGWLEWGLG